MRVNEENFVTGDAEDIEPSYVEAVIENHNNDEGAHPEIQAFYQSAKDSAAGAAEAAQVAARAAEENVKSVEETLSEMKKVADDVSLAVERYPYIGENNNWFIFDAKQGVYVDSGASAEGTVGPQGEIGPQGEKGDKGERGETGEPGTNGVDGLTPVKGIDYWTEEDINSLMDELQISIGRCGAGENAEIFNDYETNKAFSNYTHAEGYSTTSGMMGFYYYSIEFGEDSDQITLTDTQNELSDKDFSEILAKYPEGAVISLVNNEVYLNCSKILAINGNVVTVEKLPFTELQWGLDLAMDGYSFWVETNPEIGVVPLGWHAHSEGEKTKAFGRASHAEGRNTKAGYIAHAEGQTTEATGLVSHAEGFRTHAEGKYSHAEGSDNYAIGSSSHAEGSHTRANGLDSHAEGLYTNANGDYSHAEGSHTQANGHYSHAEGYGTKTIDESAHAEGYYTTASRYSHAEGYRTTANGHMSHTEGDNTNTKGTASHAEGYHTNANGHYSHAEGYYTNASGNYQHVQGKYNVGDTENKYAHIVGGGSSDTDRKNIHAIDWNGNAEFAGTVKSNGKLLATEEYVQNYIDEAILGGAW